MSLNNELAVDHIKGAEESLAYLKVYLSGKVEHEENDIKWHFRRARLCLDKAERVLSEMKSNSEQEPPLQQAAVMRGHRPETPLEDAVEFIANALGEEAKLRQMFDLWCFDQLGNTEEAREKADAMFTAARDIFYRSSSGGA